MAVEKPYMGPNAAARFLETGVCKTLEECDASTLPLQIAGANALKELKEKLGDLEFRNNDGIPEMKFESEGADAWRPFSSGKGVNFVKLGGAGTYDLSNFENFETFRVNQNIFIIPNTSSKSQAGWWETNATSCQTESYVVNDTYIGAQCAFTPPSATYDAATGQLVVSNGSLSGGSYDSKIISHDINKDVIYHRYTLSDHVTSTSVTCTAYLMYSARNKRYDTMAEALHAYYGDRVSFTYGINTGGLDGHGGASCECKNGGLQVFHDLLTNNGYVASGYGGYDAYVDGDRHIKGYLYPGGASRDDWNYNAGVSKTITYTWVGV